MNGTALARSALMERSILIKNLSALETGGQELALAWLKGAPPLKSVTEVAGEGGELIPVVAGQSQASRRDPIREARQWLDKARERSPWPRAVSPLLFGLGSPWAAALLLEEGPGPLLVFEPDPLVALAALSALDFSPALSDPAGGLRLLTPWHLSRGLDLSAPPLLVHPPAQRREPARLSRLRRFLAGPGPDLSAYSGRDLKLMIIPPLSGGSWPVAVSLARAVEMSSHQLFFLDWEADLKRLETEVHCAPSLEEGDRLLTRLFERAGLRAAEAAAGFQPDLILALAQAPLDASALVRLRETWPALLAFWLVEDFTFFNYVAEVAPAYDFLFHIQEGLIDDALSDWGLDRSAYLPLAADPNLFQPRSPEEVEVYQADLSFMGAGYPNRRRLLSWLAVDYWPRTGRPTESFRIFGSGWDGIDSRLRPYLFEGGRRVSQPECALIFSGGRVNLNIHSSVMSSPEFFPDRGFVNPRTFEIAAAGSLQIIDPRPLLPPLFEAGRELVVAESPEALPDLISHYLAHPEEATAIGWTARSRVLAEHTYSHRLNQLLAHLGWRDESEL